MSVFHPKGKEQRSSAVQYSICICIFGDIRSMVNRSMSCCYAEPKRQPKRLKTHWTCDGLEKGTRGCRHCRVACPGRYAAAQRLWQQLFRLNRSLSRKSLVEDPKKDLNRGLDSSLPRCRLEVRKHWQKMCGGASQLANGKTLSAS